MYRPKGVGLNQVNRALIISLALALIVAMAALSFFVWADATQLSAVLADLSTYLNGHDEGSARLIFTLAALLGMVLALLVVMLEVSPPDIVSDELEIRGGGATLVVSREATAQRLADALLQLPDVLSVEVHPETGKGTVFAQANLIVVPEVSPAQISEAAAATLDAVLFRELGTHLDLSSRIRVSSGQRLADALEKLTPPSPEAGIGSNQA